MMNSQYLKEKYYKTQEHPYRTYEKKIESLLFEGATLLDAGCGRTTPVLKKFVDKAERLIGIDLEERADDFACIEYITGNISCINIPTSSVDIAISRAVLEHVENPTDVFREIRRILKPDGNFIFLIPNLWDYASILSLLIPNRFHSLLVSKTEGRNAEDTFPAYYRVNTYSAIKKIADRTGFEIADFRWLGQYPNYFMFNSLLFFMATIYEKLIKHINSFKFLRGWLLVHLKKK